MKKRPFWERTPSDQGFSPDASGRLRTLSLDTQMGPGLKGMKTLNIMDAKYKGFTVYMFRTAFIVMGHERDTSNVDVGPSAWR